MVFSGVRSGNQTGRAKLLFGGASGSPQGFFLMTYRTSGQYLEGPGRNASFKQGFFPMKNVTFIKIKMLTRSLAVDLKAVANVKTSRVSTVVIGWWITVAFVP